MTYLFNAVSFPESSRLTGIWNNRDAAPSTDDEIATGHFIALPEDQHLDVEADFLTAHIPYWVASLGGAFADGQPWLFVLQKAPADASRRLVGAADPAWVLRDSLYRALRFNDGAQLRQEFVWSHADLLDVYEWVGVDPDAVAGWSVAELLRGLLTECCHADLVDVVDASPSGCAFPDVEHDCAGDAFTDVFARWGAGEMTPSWDSEVASESEEPERAEDAAAYLQACSRAELEAIAREFGIRRRKKSTGKKRSRRKLVSLILTADGYDR